MSQLTWHDRQELAERFAPRLVLFPEQQSLSRPGKDTPIIGDYHPRSVDLLLERAVVSMGWLKPRLAASLDVLARCVNARDQLLLLGKTLPDPEFAWDKFFELLNHRDAQGKTGRDRFPVTAYAHVLTRAEANAASQDKKKLGKAFPLFPDEVGRPFFKPATVSDDDVAIQYWFCYFYDDWANQHEGDWEGICIFLRRVDQAYVAVGASYFEHETGKRRHWSDVEKSTDDKHPLVFVAAGSHASYFQYIEHGYWTTVPGFIIPVLGLRFKVDLSSTRVDRVADTRHVAPITPRIELLPDPVGPSDSDDPAWSHKKWLSFPGTWGVRVLTGLAYGGPLGPSQKGLKWHNPFAWLERKGSPDFLVY